MPVYNMRFIAWVENVFRDHHDELTWPLPGFEWGNAARALIELRHAANNILTTGVLHIDATHPTRYLSLNQLKDNVVGEKNDLTTETFIRDMNLPADSTFPLLADMPAPPAVKAPGDYSEPPLPPPPVPPPPPPPRTPASSTSGAGASANKIVNDKGGRPQEGTAPIARAAPTGAATSSASGASAQASASRSQVTASASTVIRLRSVPVTPSTPRPAP